MNILGPSATLRSQSRLPTLTPLDAPPGLSAAELVTLVVCGALMAATFIVSPTLHLRLPGHAIVQVLFPIGLGIALAPRLGSATIVTFAGLAIFLTLRTFDVAKAGAGGLTCFAVGPVLDLVLLRARRGWQIYFGFVLAALGTNVVALLIRGGFKLADPSVPRGGRGGGGGGGGTGGGGGLHRRTVEEWWEQASVMFPIWGLVAGLVVAALWFRLRTRPTRLPPTP